MKTCCFLIPLLSVAVFMVGSPVASASVDSPGLPVRKDKKVKKENKDLIRIIKAAQGR